MEKLLESGIINIMTKHTNENNQKIENYLNNCSYN